MVRNRTLVSTAGDDYSSNEAIRKDTEDIAKTRVCFHVSGFLKLNRGQNYVMVGNQTMVSTAGDDYSTTESSQVKSPLFI